MTYIAKWFAGIELGAAILAIVIYPGLVVFGLTINFFWGQEISDATKWLFVNTTALDRALVLFGAAVFVAICKLIDSTTPMKGGQEE